ncbi:hypothetical protein TNCV_1237041 [Trichonephila clavipes]|nr:hypothetical protein TNCV_1237041 [Trichonephila clavipes]
MPSYGSILGDDRRKLPETSTVRSSSACGIAIKINIKGHEDLVVDIKITTARERTVICVCKLCVIGRVQSVNFLGALRRHQESRQLFVSYCMKVK